MKKWICVLLLCLLTASTIFPVSLFAAEPEYETVSEDEASPGEEVPLSELDVSGDYEYEVSGGKAKITEYRGDGGAVTIPGKLGGVSVTEIGTNAFYANSEITSVTMPSTLTDIGQYAFFTCKNLKSVKWSPNLKKIDHMAFKDCSSLATMNFPSKLEYIGAFAFSGSEAVTSITIPASVKEIWNDAFAKAVNLKTVNYNAENCTIQYGTFRSAGKNSGSVKMNVGDGVTVIPENVFYGGTDDDHARLTEVSISDSVKTIGYNAFRYCEDLKKIKWGSGLETIGGYAFADCTSLKSVILPDSVKTIEKCAFYNDTGITEALLPAGVLNAKEAFCSCRKLKKFVVFGNTEFGDNDFYDAAYGFTIYCYKNSNAEQMALDCYYNIEYLRKKYFPDVSPLHPYQKAVYWCVDEHIAAGYNNGNFGISDNVTRGQVMMFLWRLAGKPDPVGSKQKFKDVPTDHSFYKAIQWGVEQGITGGYTGSRKGYFGVKDDCTRGQIVTFIWRFFGKPEPNNTTSAEFSDVPLGHSFFKPVQWAAEENITSGYKNGTFGVNKSCTRGHCVTFIYKAVEVSGS